MKQSPVEKAQQERLSPSRFSAYGFMGADRRSLEQIVADDKAVLSRLGTTPAELARRLRLVDSRARAAMGAPISPAPGISARYHEAMGRIPSPFPGDGVYPKGETHIEWNDGRSLRVTPLGIALIELHGFFQGAGSPYRIDPATAAELAARIEDKAGCAMNKSEPEDG